MPLRTTSDPAAQPRQVFFRLGPRNQASEFSLCPLVPSLETWLPRCLIRAGQMSVRIQFDQPEQRCYTNLDFVSGNVVLVLPQDATISAVTVKLEAESKTRLAAPKFPGNERSDRKRSELEVHKVGESTFSRLQPALMLEAPAVVQGYYRFSDT